MTGIKFNLHSFTLAEEAKELVFPEETGQMEIQKEQKRDANLLVRVTV